MVDYFRRRWRSLLDTFLAVLLLALVLGIEPILDAPSLGAAWSLAIALLASAAREAVLRVRARILKEAPRA